MDQSEPPAKRMRNNDGQARIVKLEMEQGENSEELAGEKTDSMKNRHDRKVSSVNDPANGISFEKNQARNVELEEGQEVDDHACESVDEMMGSRKGELGRQVVGAKPRAKKEKIPWSTRYENIGKHFPLRGQRARCKEKNCMLYSVFYCMECKVHLCIKSGQNCFYNFHHKKPSSATTKQKKNP